MLNTEKTKIVVFRKHFIYLGAVFSSGGSFLENQKTLAGQAQKAVFSGVGIS